MGIEPTRPAWKAGILPLNYTRMDDPFCISLEIIAYMVCFVKPEFQGFAELFWTLKNRPQGRPGQNGEGMSGQASGLCRALFGFKKCRLVAKSCSPERSYVNCRGEGIGTAAAGCRLWNNRFWYIRWSWQRIWNNCNRPPWSRNKTT